MAAQMIVKMDPDLKAKVYNFAKIEGKNVSEVVRELLEEYVRDRDIASYIDDLWKRIGDKLASGGVGPADIERVIRRARAEN